MAALREKSHRLICVYIRVCVCVWGCVDPERRRLWLLLGKLRFPSVRGGFSAAARSATQIDFDS